jgi:FkbM family methyltransferase
VIEGIKRYSTIGGPAGVAAAISSKLIGWPKTLTVRPNGISHPVTLRLRTSDAYVFDEVFHREEYAIDLLAPKVIIDAGANIGLASVYFANRFPNARIIAVEPELSNYEVLVRNTKAYKKITPVRAALWKSDGQVFVDAPSPSSRAEHWAFVTREKGRDAVEAVTVSSLCERFQIRSVDLLKVDIEGAEVELFSQDAWLDRVSCIMIELHDRFRPGCTEIVHKSLDHDFEHSDRGDIRTFVRKRVQTVR